MLYNNGRKCWAIVVGISVAFLPSFMMGAEAGKADPRVIDVGEKVEGKTYPEWSAAWRQWAR